MDARIDPSSIFGLHEGDVHVLRNAGGLVTDDVIRSLVLSQRVLRTQEVVIMQHTDCGLHRFRDADLEGRLTAQVGEAPPFTFGGFDDLDGSVRDGMARIRTSPWLETEQMVRGFVYDVETGALREVAGEE